MRNQFRLISRFAVMAVACGLAAAAFAQTPDPNATKEEPSSVAASKKTDSAPHVHHLHAHQWLRSSKPTTQLSDKPGSGIDVAIFKDNKPAGEPATTDTDGTVTFQLPTAGTYTFRYASGPNKDKVIKTITARARDKRARPIVLRCEAHQDGKIIHFTWTLMKTP